MKKTIALDFDGVIAGTDRAKVEFAREKLGLEIEERNAKQRYFEEIFGYSQGVHFYSRLIDGVYNSERMLTSVSVVSGAKEGIVLLQNLGWRCIVVTSRQGEKDGGPDSQAMWAWRFLLQHGFPLTQNDFYHVNGESKLTTCLNLEAQALVDDDYQKLLPLIEAGIRGFLFSTQTNRYEEYVPFLGTRVRDWPDLVRILTETKDDQTFAVRSIP